MSGTFQNYDTNRDNIISPAEWAVINPDKGGPPQGAAPSPRPTGGAYDFNGDGVADPYTWLGEDAAAAPDEGFDLDTFIDKVSSGTFTDDDMLAFSNWYMGQQLGQQAGQMDYQDRYLDYLGQVLEGDQQKLSVAKQEMDFQQGPYWDWYVEEYFPNQQQREEWDFQTANNKFDTDRYLMENQRYISDIGLDVAGIDKKKAMDYATAQMYGTEQAKYGADAARWQYLQMIENPPDQSQGPRRSLGMY